MGSPGNNVNENDNNRQIKKVDNGQCTIWYSGFVLQFLFLQII
jgi:hypothetical protein